jgi:arabinofuranosyltransferase
VASASNEDNVQTIRLFADNILSFILSWLLALVCLLLWHRKPQVFRLLGLAMLAGMMLILALYAVRWVHLVRHSFLPPYTWDDAYIFLRYVENWIGGHGFVWNVGTRVEGYSSPLYLFVLSGISWIGFNPAYVAAVLNPLLLIVVLWLAAFLSGRLRGESFFRPPLNTALVLCSPLLFRLPLFLESGVVFDGMETMLVSGCLLLAVVAFDCYVEKVSLPRLGFFIGSMVLLTLVRPEGLILALALLLVFCFVTSGFRASFRWPVLIVLLAVAAQLLWRHHYYGDWVPNTYYAKAYGADRLVLLGRGVRGALSWALGLGLCYIVWLPLFAWRGICPRPCVKSSREWRTLIFSGCVVAGFTALIVVNGSNSMWRLLPCVLPVAAIVADVAWHRCWAAAVANRQLWLRWATATLFVPAVIPALVGWHAEGLPLPRIPEPMNSPYVGAALRLRAIIKPGEAVAVNAVGVISYVLIDNPVIDEFGLNDRDIAKAGQGRRGRGTAGHEAYDWTIVLAREPAYILTRSPPGVVRFDETFPTNMEFYAYRDLFIKEDFKSRYVLLTEFNYASWSIPTKTQVWVRRDLYDARKAELDMGESNSRQ